jgi:hypothetical protein
LQIWGDKPPKVMPAIRTAYSVNHTAFNGGILMDVLKLRHGLIGATTLRAVKLTDQVTQQKFLNGFGDSMPCPAPINLKEQILEGRSGKRFRKVREIFWVWIFGPDFPDFRAYRDRLPGTGSPRIPGEAQGAVSLYCRHI